MGKTKEITRKTTKENSTTSKQKNSTKKITKSTKSKKDKKEKKPIHKIIFLCVSLIIIITLCFLPLFLKNKENIVITIDNIKYTESDFNMYAYLIKYDYFGIDGTELSENILNTQVSNDSDKTIAEYLKEETISKIKLSAAILRIANEHNITLTEEDLKEIEADKTDFVEKLGGMKAYKSMLRNNHTTSESYLKAAKANKLYDKIFDNLYAKDKRYDFSNEELEELTNNYNLEYVKIKQIILLKKDLATNKYFDDTTINQKEFLAQELLKMIQLETDFDSLIKKYSESYDGEIKSEYYKKSELIEKLRNAIDLLDIGGISDVISTDYAYHIVVKEQLDDAKLEEYYDSKREEKLIENITENLNKIVISKSNYLNEITIK